MSYDERVNLQKLWKIVDQIATAAQDCEQGHLDSDAFLRYVSQKCRDGLRVPFPGEPPELTGAEVKRILADIERREKGNK